MESNLFGFYPMVDPLKYMEMQAQYLRILAQYLTDPEPNSYTFESEKKPDSKQEREKSGGKTLVSEWVQVELLSEKADPRQIRVEPPLGTIPEETISPEFTKKEKVAGVQEVQTQAVLVIPASKSRPEAENPVPRSARRGKNFDDIPISAGKKNFEEMLEEELRKDSLPSDPPAVAKAHSFLKRNTGHALTAPKPQSPGNSPHSTPAEERKPQESETGKTPPKEYLKRRTGLLCMGKGQVLRSSPKGKKGRSPPAEQATEWQGLAADYEEVMGPPGVDVLARLKKEVSDLTAAVEKLRDDSSSGSEDVLNAAFESVKNERVKFTQARIRQEIDLAKREEASKIARERKTQEKGPQPSATEGLKSRIRKLQEEAKISEENHRAAIDSVKSQIEDLRRSSRKPDLKSPDPTPQRQKFTFAPEKSVEKLIPETAKTDEKPGLESMQLEQQKTESKTGAGPVVKNQIVSADGKVQRIYEDGTKEIIFTNGVRKEAHPDGFTVVYFTNSDVKQTFPDGKVVYKFAEAQTTQTTYPDKLQVFQFANGQVEKHFPDGTKEIKFTDGTVKCIFPDGEEESIFPDGTVQKIDRQGIKYIDSVNGQKDTIYPDGSKVREYPDGSVRKFSPDGKAVET